VAADAVTVTASKKSPSMLPNSARFAVALTTGTNRVKAQCDIYIGTRAIWRASSCIRCSFGSWTALVRPEITSATNGTRIAVNVLSGAGTRGIHDQCRRACGQVEIQR
jgi:hypothetical protein